MHDPANADLVWGALDRLTSTEKRRQYAIWAYLRLSKVPTCWTDMPQQFSGATCTPGSMRHHM